MKRDKLISLILEKIPVDTEVCVPNLHIYDNTRHVGTIVSYHVREF
jgi:hypothetical protein